MFKGAMHHQCFCKRRVHCAHTVVKSNTETLVQCSQDAMVKRTWAGLRLHSRRHSILKSSVAARLHAGNSSLLRLLPRQILQ
eukprot:3330320-Pleurochrysis_carterae.AAC.5